MILEKLLLKFRWRNLPVYSFCPILKDNFYSFTVSIYLDKINYEVLKPN